MKIVRRLFCKLGWHKWEIVPAEELRKDKPFWVASQYLAYPEYVVCKYCGKPS